MTGINPETLSCVCLCLFVCLFVTSADSGFGDYKNEGSVLRDTLLTDEISSEKTSRKESTKQLVVKLQQQ